MGCNCCHESGCHTGKKRNQYLPATISLLMLLAGVTMNYFGLFRWPGSAFAWYALAYLPVGLPVLKEALHGLRRREFFNEFTLMGIATIGAFCIGEYPEGVAVMLFYSIGEHFQESAVGRAQKNIKALLDIRPETATVIRNGRPVETHPRDVEPGETLEVKTGGRIPLDGILQTERASFNTAALTGESVPRTIRKGEAVLAGMIVTDRVISLTVDKPYDQSALSRILAMVQDATERKAPAELFIRRFARVYTPIVVGLAALIVLLPFLSSLLTPSFGFVFSEWLYRALVFLVISCPCALVVSIPLGYFGGIGAASRAGILFKGGNYLDAITKVNTVVFDKTGTLTRGVFEVRRVESVLPGGEEELLSYVAAAEEKSNHPVARAILRYASRSGEKYFAPTSYGITPVGANNYSPNPATQLPPLQVEEIAGHGLRACINGKEVLVGNGQLLRKNGIAYPPELDEIADTTIFCAIDHRYAGYLVLADEPKPDAARAIAELKRLNIDNIQILSGDKQKIVSNLAEKLGVTLAYGDLLPEGKVKHLEALKANPANRVAFVGDGINDAPVLALSDVGIAMGSLGSDAAIETADVVIQTDQPSRIATAIRIGRATRRIVWQNIGLAFGVKLAVLLLGAGGMATLWEAVFADVGVALIAILNAIRISDYGRKYLSQETGAAGD